MVDYNPYAAPAADLSTPAPSDVNSYTPGMIEQLRATKPWVRFASVLLFIGAGVVAVTAVVMVAGVAISAGEGPGGPALAGVGVLYLLGAGVYVLLGLNLHRYAEAISEAALGGGAPAVEKALACQKSFWKSFGILCIVALALGVLTMAGAMAAGIASAW